MHINQSSAVVAAVFWTALSFAAFAQQDPQRIVTRRGANDVPPSARTFQNVPGVGIVGYTDVEIRWINQLDQLLNQYQQQNPHQPGSEQWLDYLDSLVAWYQEQNPYEFGTNNWQAFNNRIIDWFLRQNPFETGTDQWEQYVGLVGEPEQIYGRPVEPTPPYQPPDFEQYMQQVYATNPYIYGTLEWDQYTNFYINEYNRLYGSVDVTPDGVPLWQQPLTQQPDTVPPDWTRTPFPQPPTAVPQPEQEPALRQREQARLPVTRPIRLPQDRLTHPRTAHPQPPQDTGQPWTVPEDERGLTHPRTAFPRQPQSSAQP